MGFPRQEYWSGLLFLLQGLFPTQGSNMRLPHCRQILYHWVTREAQEYWSGSPLPSPGDLPDPGIEPGSPASQADSLPAELPGQRVKSKVADSTGEVVSIVWWWCCWRWLSLLLMLGGRLPRAKPYVSDFNLCPSFWYSVSIWFVVDGHILSGTSSCSSSIFSHLWRLCVGMWMWERGWLSCGLRYNGKVG